MPRQISLQKRIRSLVIRNNDKMAALIALLNCFDNRGKLNESFKGQADLAIWMAQQAIDFEQSIYKHASSKALEAITKDIDHKLKK